MSKLEDITFDSLKIGDTVWRVVQQEYKDLPEYVIQECRIASDVIPDALFADQRNEHYDTRAVRLVADSNSESEIMRLSWSCGVYVSRTVAEVDAMQRYKGHIRTLETRVAGMRKEVEL